MTISVRSYFGSAFLFRPIDFIHACPLECIGASMRCVACSEKVRLSMFTYHIVDPAVGGMRDVANAFVVITLRTVRNIVIR